VSDNIITSEIGTEAAIWAVGTRYTKSYIIRAYRSHVEVCREVGCESLDIQRYCEEVLGIDPIAKGDDQ
jgi:hypothetical protein